MAVSFITGRIPCNRTDKILDICFEKAQEKSRKPIYILVPEKYSYEMEKRLSERLLTNKDPYFRIRVVSFSTLSRIVYTNVGGLKERKISQSARAMLVYKAVDSVANDLVTFKAEGTGVGIIDKIMDMIIEFKQNDMTVDDLEKMASKTDDEALKYKIKDLARVYEKYEDLIENKYFDTEDNLEFFAKKLDKFEDIKGATIFVDEFTGFTPIQYKIIEKLMIYSEDIYFSLMTDLKGFNSKKGVFANVNKTFIQLNELCSKNSLKRGNDIVMSRCKYYENSQLEHLERNINEFKAVEYRVSDSENIGYEAIEIREFSNTHKEVEHIADEITRLVRDKGYRYREITVAMRDLDSYSYLIKGMFENYDIGYFIDEKIAAKNNPIIVLILSILEMKQKNYSYDSMFRYLKSGLTSIDIVDISMIENYVLANGIKGKRWFDERWEYPISHGLEDVEVTEEKTKAYIDNINEIKDRIMEAIIPLHKKLAGKNTVEDICSYLYEFTLDIALPERIDRLIEKFEEEGNLYKAKEYSQVWGIFIDMLDELVEFIGNEKIGLNRFMKLMEAEFEGFELGIIPPSRDQVFVTTVERMKNPDTKILFLIGVCDGVFPQNISNNAMINDNDRNKLLDIGVKFDKDLASRAYDEQFLIYKAMSISKKKLVISYPISDFEGKSQRPSPIIKKVKKIFPKLKVKFEESNKVSSLDDILKNLSSKEKLFEKLQEVIKADSKDMIEDKEREAWLSIYNYFKNDDCFSPRLDLIGSALNYRNTVSRMDKKLAENIYGKGIFSISKLEKYASCPFSYFLRYGLRAKEREVYEFTAMDSGIYAHKIIDEFSKQIVQRDNIDWKDISRDYIEESIRRISRDIIEKRQGYILKSSAKHKYLAHRINNNLIDSIEIMIKQINKGDFLPKSFEVEFGFKGGLPPIRYRLRDNKEIVLTGKIDRVDIYNDGEIDYVRVIDYKSSTKELNMDKIMAGIQMQLFIYMNAVLNSNKKIESYSVNKDIEANYKPAALLYSRFNPIKVKLDCLDEAEKMDEEELEKNRLSENKLKGFVIKNPEIVNHLDKTVDVENKKSDIMSIEIKKDGNLAARTVGLYEEDFDVVKNYIIDKTEEICEAIYSGKIDIEPYKFDNEIPCTYCEFKSICKFDPTIKGNRYRVIKKLAKNGKYDDVISKMKEKLRDKKKAGEESVD